MASHYYPGDPSTISSGLLNELREGNDNAWCQFVNLYGPLVYHWARTSGLQPNDASEITQNVFCAVLSGIQCFKRCEAQHSFRGWLHTITMNKIRDEARRHLYHPVVHETRENAELNISKDGHGDDSTT